MHSPIPIHEVILPRFSSVTLSDAVQLVPAERAHYVLQNIETETTSSSESHCRLDIPAAQSFSLCLGGQATSAFVPISPPIRSGFPCVHLRKKSNPPSIGEEVLDGSDSDHDEDPDTTNGWFAAGSLQESPYHDESDDGFFLLAPGLDNCPDLSTRERRGKKRMATSPTLELLDGPKQETMFSLYMPPSTIHKRKPKISLQPRMKKNVVFF
jgi:hypothetical protein